MKMHLLLASAGLLSGCAIGAGSEPNAQSDEVACGSNSPTCESTATTMQAVELSMLEIMPLGASITAGFREDLGYKTTGGYRVRLKQLLNDSGVNVDFVGSQTCDVPEGFTDCEHEGYPGKTIEFIKNKVTQTPGSVLTPSHNTILMQVGTNDLTACVRQANPVGCAGEAAGRMSILIDEIRARTSAQVYVSALGPIKNVTDTMLDKFNGEVRTKANGTTGVHFVDMSLTDLLGPDGIHPTANGYAAMADQWLPHFPLVRTVDSSDALPEYVRNSAPEGTYPSCFNSGNRCTYLEWNGRIYAAYTYYDNRESMPVRAFRMADGVELQAWELGWARYLEELHINRDTHTVTFVDLTSGYGSSLTLDDLELDWASTP